MWKIALAVGSTVIVLGLLLGSCAPAAQPAPAPTATGVAATVPETAPVPTAAPTPATTRAATPGPAPMVRPPAAPTSAPSVPAKPRYGGMLRVAGVADLTHYDLHQTPTYLDLHALAPVYSLLVRSDPKDIDKVVPDLAERWEISPDGKSYTFYLHKGAKWHNGQPVTSADVKASFDRIVAPPKGITSFRQGYFEAVEKIETPDAQTVKFSLKWSQASFPTMVSIPFNVVFPKALLDTKPDMKRDILGSGPFKVKEHIRGVQFTVEKNPDYFTPGRPYLDGAVRYIIPDAASIKGALVSGLVDVHYGGRFSEAEVVAMPTQNPQLTVQRFPGLSVPGLIPNLKRKPWDDLRVRRAVHLGVDGAAIGQLVYPGQYLQVGFMFPSSWAIPPEELVKLPGWRKPTAEDTAEAKRLLAEAGYAKGFTTTLLVRGMEEYIKWAVVAQEQLAKLGITAKLDILETGAYNAKRAAKDWDAMAYAAYSVEVVEPDVILSRYLTGAPGNYSQYSNPRVDELFRQQSESTDVAQRKKLVLEIQRIMMEDLPYMPWFTRKMPVVFSSPVKDYYWPNQYLGSHALEDVWLAQ